MPLAIQPTASIKRLTPSVPRRPGHCSSAVRLSSPANPPGNIKLAISPNVPSEVFASVTQREDPQPPGDAPLLGVFRTLDGGVNWTPVLLANPTSPVNDPNNYMNIYGDDNNVIAIGPNSPANPLQQIVYLAGYGSTDNSTVLYSTNSGALFTAIGVGDNGIGTYPNVHAASFDARIALCGHRRRRLPS